MTSPRQELKHYVEKSIPMFIEMYVHGSISRERMKIVAFALASYMDSCKRPGRNLRNAARDAYTRVCVIAFS